MATEDEIVLEDDYNYIAVSRGKGPSRTEDGTVCWIEVGRGSEAPDDREAKLFPVCKDGVMNLIEALQSTLND